MGRDVYIGGRPIELILANWDKTMICGSIDSSIWQSDQQVRRHWGILFHRSRELFIFAVSALFRDTNDMEECVLIDGEDFLRLRRCTYKSCNWKYDINATNRCDNNEYLLFSEYTPRINLIVLCQNRISFDVNRNDHRLAHSLLNEKNGFVQI